MIDANAMSVRPVGQADQRSGSSLYVTPVGVPGCAFEFPRRLNASRLFREPRMPGMQRTVPIL